VADSSIADVMLRLLCVSAYNAWSLSMCGPSAVAKGAFEFMGKPVVGQIVMETSTIWTPGRDAHRIGRLLRIETRPTHTNEEWLALGETDVDDINSCTYWVIDPLYSPWTEYHWHNASFISVPERLLTSLRGDLFRSRTETK
jgi:hypothetical protein